MHDDVHLASLLFVYGLLLGNCGYQTDRKIYDQSEIAARLRSSGNPRAARATKLYTRSARTSCPPTDRCNTAATGWLNGGHPTVADGQVNRTVCFHYVTSGCCEWSTNIKVRNCGSYYVYYLSGTPTCNLGYCGTN
ncbi:unnamed protein product [Porites lobata]|uniref:UMOD/GP2/OIT3-like D8C domain-containing protein n=1 Tax=Porites lobata TaxID=104759 RepID=A0ABN8S950_9CNID|nr:unnamed protein product [Porites lobata]